MESPKLKKLNKLCQGFQKLSAPSCTSQHPGPPACTLCLAHSYQPGCRQAGKTGGEAWPQGSQMLTGCPTYCPVPQAMRPN